MRLYQARYKRQSIDGVDTDYTNQQIVVAAMDLQDATFKILETLHKIEKSHYKNLLVGAIIPLNYMCFEEGFEGSLNVLMG